MSLQFDDATHTYRLDGRVIPSVTQILKQVVDFSMVPPDVLERKCALGSALHMAIALDHEGDLDEDSVDPAVRPYLDGWRKFVADMGRALVIHAAEVPMASKRYGYGVTPDIWGAIGGEPCVVELKSSSVIHPATALQTAAQEAAIFEAGHFSEFRTLVVRRFCVQLKPTGGYAVKEFNSAGDFGVFLALRSVWGWRAANKLGV